MAPRRPGQPPEPCEECDETAAHEYGSTGGSVSDAKWDGAASRFTDEQYKMSCAACENGGKTPKSDCFLPHHEPGGATNRNGVHAAAGRVGSLKGKDSAAVARAKSHLRSHYKALKEDPPDSIKASRVPTASRLESHMAAAHGSTNGSHSHAHPAYGSQRNDETHQHMHSHSNDSNHKHDHGAAVRAAGSNQMPYGITSFVAAAPAMAGQAPPYAENIPWAVTASGDPADTGIDMLGADWGVRQDGDRWVVLTASGMPWEPPAGSVDVQLNDNGVVQWEPGRYESYAAAVNAIAEQLASEGPNRPVLAETWRSEMAFEDRSTGDGRKIEKGAIGYRNTPMPLMLQTQTAGGHMGAVLCGAIQQTGKLGTTALGSGEYDATEAGRQAKQIVAARSRFGVSIDVAEAEGEFHCTEYDDEGFCVDGEMVFSLIKVMGLTMTPFPAFEDAFLENVAADEEVAASSAPKLDVPADLTFTEGGELDEGMVAVLKAPAEIVDGLVITAAAKAEPPDAAWFDDPRFEPGDGRMVRQPNGSYACPATVVGRRVYGHMAAWRSCHTGYRNTCVAPPRSHTNYAAFMLKPPAVGPMLRADGTPILVGQISMGGGHAPDDPNTPLHIVRAHYDGGPGVTLVADICVGEDSYGIWFAGMLRPDVTDSQARTFASLAVSGDWREVWRGKGLDLVALAAGIVSPGFPVAAMAAAGYELSVPDGPAIGTARVSFRDGRPVVLVAAGVVAQPLPWDRQAAHLAELLEAEQAERAKMGARVDRLERTIREFRRAGGLDLLAEPKPGNGRTAPAAAK